MTEVFYDDFYDNFYDDFYGYTVTSSSGCDLTEVLTALSGISALIENLPTNSEFEARTLPSGEYGGVDYNGQYVISDSNIYYKYNRILNNNPSNYAINCSGGNSHGLVGLIFSSGNAVRLGDGHHSLMGGSINCPSGTAFHSTGSSHYFAAKLNEIYCNYLVDADLSLSTLEAELTIGKAKCLTSLIRSSSSALEVNIRDSTIYVDGNLIEDNQLAITSILRFFNCHITADIACTQGILEFYNCSIDGSINFSGGGIYLDPLTSIGQATIIGSPTYLNNQISTLPTTSYLSNSGVNVSSLSSGAVEDIFSTYVVSESYASDGVAGTPAQLLYLMQQAFTEFTIVGTTITVKRLDGSTNAATFTMDSATTPTSRTRST